ncbi:oligopeptidase A [Halieaceae bacterium IMCC14734]|uniref:oligopeptidase A n=1 Tax=Candidatus Litorirhabdus singularis TaxID=2518993 RepID=A0ABT3TKW4_9GAMM|nr:oligopeptidase A [Candidatus Litorirhabdus singularis]MCX2982959.1 oligopeptidase A [Candidatus Litorirhabdus singularis]
MSLNPLLSDASLPRFCSIKPEHVEPALDEILAMNRHKISALLEQPPVAASSFLQQLESLDDDLNRLWSQASHLHGVMNSESMRETYSSCLPKLTAYYTELGQHAGLYQRYSEIADSAEFAELKASQRKAIEHQLRDFRLSGIALETAAQQRYATIKARLAEVTTNFSNHVLDATQGWHKHLTTAEQLPGLPANTLDSYREAAQEKGLEGYVITLDIPAYLPLMQYCDDAQLRQEMYQAYSTRASDQGPDAGKWDNSKLIDEILDLRHELAQLLGFADYAQYSLETKMAEAPASVVDFLMDMATRSRAVAQNDFRQLAEFAAEQGCETLSAWDVPYYSEKLRLAQFDLSQEQLRPYFPIETVIKGLFEVAGRLFGINVSASSAEVWHEDVRFYEISRDGKVIARFYLDLFARANKRGGAWMADCHVRRNRDDGSLQLPVAFLVCNFTPPTATTPSLLNHNEVTTLFHEFGHGLHHMLTQIDCAAVSGINGVPWDAVELPSQFLENWCWEKQVIPLISAHYETGEPLPTALLDKMLAARNFQSGMQIVRQLEFALFDLRIHSEYQPDQPSAVQSILDEVRAGVAVSPVPAWNRFQHGFSHIFAGGYAAGYYSYKWAEVLSADAFSSFEEEGIFNPATGQRFLEEILQQGGAREPLDAFKRFRGREPSAEALLRHAGISASNSNA